MKKKLALWNYNIIIKNKKEGNTYFNQNKVKIKKIIICNKDKRKLLLISGKMFNQSI